MISSDNLRRLHFINALFAGLTDHDLYLAQQIESAITVSLAGAEQQPPSEPAFNAAATKLLERLCAGRRDHGFFHWNAAESDTAATPLFARQRVLAGLKRLAGFREATLLITNLRPAHGSTGRRWTRRRENEYRETLALIRDLAAERSCRSANLNLLFL